ncbi:MAG: MFS transporter [Mycobacteriales bacterium]
MPPRTWLRETRSGVLAERDPRLYLTAYLASMIGTGITPVALAFAVLENGGTTSQVGAVLAAETAPLVLLLLAAGVVADRLPRRTVLVGSDVLSCASQIVLAVLLFRGTPHLWQLMACAGVLGACQAFHGPAQTGLIPEITSCG